MYTNSSGKATSKYVQKNVWPTAFAPEKMGNSFLARDLCLLSCAGRAQPAAGVADAGAVAANRCHSDLTLWWRSPWRKCRYMGLHLFGSLFTSKYASSFQ